MWEALFTFGWKDENIHVLFGYGQDWEYNNPQYQASLYQSWGITSITDDAAYLEDIENIFDFLSGVLTEEDFLFVFTFDHGGYVGGYSYLQLMDGVLYDTTFARWVGYIPCDKRVFYMQQCCSGGFIAELETNSTFIMTATGAQHWASPADDLLPDGADTLENEYYPPDDDYYDHGEFDYHMFNATRLQTIIGNDLPDPDVNNDGLTTLDETFAWVDSTVSIVWPDDPQVSDPGDIGRTITLNIPPYKPTGLTGSRINNSVKLTWYTNDEWDLDHFEIYKRTYEDSTQTYTDWYYLDQTTDTVYIDDDFAPSYQGSDTVWYKIAAVDEADLVSEYSDVVSGPGEIRPVAEGLLAGLIAPDESYQLSNHPNPFNAETTIRYCVLEDAYIVLSVYDVAGREVATLWKGWQEAGEHQISFSGAEVASGIYLYRLQAGNQTITQKLALLK